MLSRPKGVGACPEGPITNGEYGALLGCAELVSRAEAGPVPTSIDITTFPTLPDKHPEDPFVVMGVPC